MKTIQTIMMTLLVMTLLAGTALAAAFESGSSCGAAFHNSTTCRGAYTPPTTTTTIALPANGILDYTTFTVPAGYTIYFTKNAANTPVIIRTSGNVSIGGVINVSALTAPTESGTAGNGNLGDDGQPGTGGPGGFDGGRGGVSPMFGGLARQPGGAGKGPGGGGTTGVPSPDYWGSACNAGGGGFGAGGGTANYGCGVGGSVYGQASLLPLIGGSGGGGGASGSSYNGAGGGGGGGAITIASSGTIHFPGGIIYANGMAGGNSGGSGCGGGGGGGSGGAIRLVADVLSMSGGPGLVANGGAGGGGGPNISTGAGGAGRIRLESNTITGWTTSNSSPAYTTWTPGHVLVPNNPTLAIVSVTPTTGPDNTVVKPAPANPTGNADITFQTGTTTATVSLSAYYIPTGSTATVYVIPSSGVGRSSSISSAFTGSSTDVSTATATITLSPGNNILQAAVTYTVTELVAMALPQFNGEYVAKIRVEGGINGKSQVTYITASGKEYPASRAKA